MFTKDDLQDLKERGISREQAEQQLSVFKKGFPYLPVTRPAARGDGILKPGEDTLEDFISLYDSGSGKENILKFVPASGAATRMFKDLYAFIGEEGRDPDNKAVDSFISGLPHFAFYEDLKALLENSGRDIESLIKRKDYLPLIKSLLDTEGLNYGNKAKGLLLFHRYDNESRTAFEEHLVEGALYCRGINDTARIHFTVSPDHKEDFNKVYEDVKDKIEKRYGLKFSVSFSTQKPSTDTIAVDAGNNPFRDHNDKLVFRPGGHGALLENLSGLDADIIFIKNIDNVVPDPLKDQTVRYKKSLGGMLISLRERIFYYLSILKNDTYQDEGLLEEIKIFLEEELYMITPGGSGSWNNEEMIKYLISKLDRPLRICGMVRNEGEPGGGPFWVKNRDGSVSLQIVESSQINLSNPLMRKLFDASTHFNPVDLVCSIKNHQGKKFDLKKFRDPETGFISKKSMEGRELKALELPGLWNGAMADWNTVFVEVPLSTFNPVKTVNDLLRPQHSVK